MDVRGRRGQRGDVRSHQHDLAVADHHVRLLEVRPPRADGLHLPAFQRKPGLQPLLDKIIVERLPVLDDAHSGSRPTRHFNNMQTVHRSVLVPYSAQQMFDLVDDVQHYCEFLPWCGGSKVIAETANGKVARVDISFKGVSAHFTTNN